MHDHSGSASQRFGTVAMIGCVLAALAACDARQQKPKTELLTSTCDAVTTFTHRVDPQSLADAYASR